MRLKLKANLLDIGTGGPLIVLLDDDTAKKLSVFVGDRLIISADGVKKTCMVNFAKNEPQDTIGIFRETARALNIKQGQGVFVSTAEMPESVDYIRKKLSGKRLSQEEIYSVIRDTVENNLTSVEIAYFVSAIYSRGCSMKETYNLTKAMVDTGSSLKWRRLAVSKHSIGGVAGNRTTMLLVPILTAVGLLMPKTSSRSITSPAGTADTMEVLAPVSINSVDALRKIVQKAGGCMVWGGALKLAPADDKLIRVEHALSIDPESMLLASILAKKKAEGSDIILIDIPVGKYSKVRNSVEFRRLKNKFLWLGKKLGMKICVMKSRAVAPIGRGIGPLLEARDVLWVLKRDSRAPKDLEEKSIFMAGILLALSRKTRTVRAGRKLARQILESGKAYEQMQKIIKAQGGDPNVNPDNLTPGRYLHTFRSLKKGVVVGINDDLVTKVAKLAGAPKDARAGIYLEVGLGDKVLPGAKLFTIYSSSDQRLKYAVEMAKEIVKVK